MLTVLTILTVAVADLLRLAQPRIAVQTMRYIQLVWWLVVTIAVVIWLRPEAWAGAVAAVIAAAWYFLAERMDRAPGPEKSAVTGLYAWSAVGLVVVIAGFAWLDITLLYTVAPTGLLWLALALFLTQSGQRMTRASLLQTGRDLGSAWNAESALPDNLLYGGGVR